MGTVYVVHCIDTEGPLYETPLVPFEMVKRVFGIDIEPTRENLIKLQNGQIPLDGNEEDVKNLVDNHKLATKGNWEEIDATLKIITSPEYRNKLVDSNGEGWKYSWFCMDHVGFTGMNPRRRDAGHHKIFDHYMDMVQQQNLGDVVQFHHHPVSLSGNYNDSGTAFWGRGNLNDILTRKIIDRGWFPVAFRPGFHTERPDSHWFLEQWIPFDYGNQSYVQTITGQADMDDGRFGDWRHAPLEWKPYHPDYADYQSKGNCKRWITRCLNMHARIRELNIKEVENAFQQAENEDVILAFTDHDYKDMIFEIDKVRKMIRTISNQYPKVRFEYCDAVSAMKKCLGLSDIYLNLEAKIIKKDNYDKLVVCASNDIFGTQPYLAIKSKKGNYYWDNFDFTGKNVWTYTFDNNTIVLNNVDTIGVAANSKNGDTKVIQIKI